jgi:hypothetical protein
MQICKSPLDAPDFDEAFVDGRYSMEKDDEVHNKFFADLKAKLIEMGYTGKLTGEIVRFPIADGAAQYMVAEGQKKTILIWLEIHDAWNIPDAHARGLNKTDIKNMVTRNERMAALFGRKS